MIVKLVKHLNLVQGAKVLDLACGRGRHAITLAEQGMDVIGIDLSAQSIRFAREFETEQLNFYTHDIREAFRINYFDATFNLFTSFGYFKDIKDDKMTIRNIQKGLRKGGYFVLDYLNSKTVLDQLVAHNTISRDGVLFDQYRSFDGAFINKTIKITDDEESFEYSEHVRAYTKDDLVSLIEGEHLEVLTIFGDYNLSPFIEDVSKRIIIISKKRS